MEGNQSRSSRLELKAETMAECCLLDFSQTHFQLSFLYTQVHVLRGDTAYSGLEFLNKKCPIDMM